MTQSNPLNPEQIASYHRDGFVHATGFFDAGEMQRITIWTQEITAWPEEPGRYMSYAPHRSGPNLTNTSWRVIYVTYNRPSAGDHRARYFADKRKHFPPDTERDPGKTCIFRV